MRAVFAGGGSAGHLFPALAVAQRFLRQAPEAEAFFLGADRPLDRDLMAQYQLTHRLLSAQGLPYGLSWRSVPSLLKLALGGLQAYQTLGRWQPQAILGTGGYIAAASVSAACLRHIPVALHVSDAFPDRTSLRLAARAQVITLAFAEAAEYFPTKRTVVTGQPVREEILQADRAQCRAALGLADNDLLLLITGGSQGAMRLNSATLDAWPKLSAAGVQVLHLTGTRDFERVAGRRQGQDDPAYRYQAYEPHMGQVLAAADMLLLRAGSSSLAEAAAWGLPLLTVPGAFAHGHQMYNARPLVERGAALLIEDSELTGERLASEVLALAQDTKRRAAMSQAARAWGSREAADRIAEQLLQVAAG